MDGGFVRIRRHSYDPVGRLSSVSTEGNPAFAYGTTYMSHGALASVVLASVNAGNQGIKVTNTYNNRLRPMNMKAQVIGGAMVLDQTYSFLAGTINDGQVKSVTNNLNLGRSQSYTYDEMNRLATAQSQANSGNDCGRITEHSEGMRTHRAGAMRSRSPVRGSWPT